MNYAVKYEALIDKRRKFPLSKSNGYCERHHYIPRCMGGGNDKWNIVNLTAKEHFIAHHLLCKINPKEMKLLNAFIAMCTKTTRQKRDIHISARRYEQLKHDYGEMRRHMFATMPDELREERRKNIKAGCARRSPEQKAQIKAKRLAYFSSLTDEEKEKIRQKRNQTIASRSEDRKNEIFETISRAHRKLSEADEQKVITEYLGGKTAKEIASEAWCELSREGVNYLLRRRGVATHAQRRWDGKIEQICEDYKNCKYPTHDALAKAYGTNWGTILKILNDNGVHVPKNPNRQNAASAREAQRLMSEHISYKAPFSYTGITDISLYDAIRRLRMFGLIPSTETQRNVLKKIRHALRGETKYAFGYEWWSVMCHLPKGVDDEWINA